MKNRVQKSHDIVPLRTLFQNTGEFLFHFLKTQMKINSYLRSLQKNFKHGENIKGTVFSM